jgi:hypothetical protein
VLTYEAVVSLIFRWIDLFVIFAVIGYVFVRWVLPFFRQEMADEQREWQGVQDRLDNAIQESLFLDHSLTKDQRTITRLESQVQQWKALCEKKNYEKDQQHQKILADLKQKNEQKVLGMIHDMVYKKVVPEALEQAERDLKKKYKESDNSSHFVQKIITKLQKGDA